MEQSPFWESNSFSASQEIPHILWKPEVHHRIHNSPLPVPILSRFRGFCYCFITWLSFYGEELVALHPTSKLEDRLLSAVRDCLFNTFAATLHIWRLFLHPRREDAPCHGDWEVFWEVSTNLNCCCNGTGKETVSKACKGSGGMEA